MKKLLLTLFLTATTVITFAQGYYGGSETKVTIGIMGGANAAFLQAKLPAEATVANNPASVGSFGINVDFKFNDYLSLRPGVFYSGKGGDIQRETTELTGFDQTEENKFSLYYLEIPVIVIGHIPLSDSFNILLGAGPYAAMGLSGNVVTSSPTIDTETDKAKFGSNGDFKSTDIGATTLLGFETQSGIIVGINYDMGLTNILNHSSSGDGYQSLKTGTVYVSVGFNL